MLGVTVVFGNDEVQQIDLRQRLNPERTQPIDLQGRAGPIKRFEIAARAGHDFHRRGILNIYAEQVHERENWELVGFGVDHDVISVGRREGRFEKIALEVSGNDVEILSLTACASSSAPADARDRSISPVYGASGVFSGGAAGLLSGAAGASPGVAGPVLGIVSTASRALP